MSLQLKQDCKKYQQTFHFIAGESVEEGVKRMICEKFDYTMWQLAEPSYGREKGVHDTRKSCKKIRAVLIETLDRISDRFTEQMAPGMFEGVRKKLIEQQQAVDKKTLEENNTVELVINVLEEARQPTHELPIKSNDYSAMRDGFRRVYRRGRKRLSEAYCDPDVKIFHDWRKRVKYLWTQCQILMPIYPGHFEVFAKNLKEISDWLGDDHDLSEFRLVLSDKPHWFDKPNEKQVLFALTEYWNQELRIIARPEGVRLYVEQPMMFSKRIDR